MPVMSVPIAEKIYDETIRNGGGTYTRDGIAAENKGFAVAVVTETYYKVALDDPDVAVEAIRGISSVYPNHYIGTWVHEGYIHIDPVKITENEGDAKYLAHRYHQIAYYDLAKGKTINVLR
jgi:hypothetical protein